MALHISGDFDFRSDSTGPDPDKSSPMLWRYHQHLWSKPLPGGVLFDLTDARPTDYLRFTTESGDFFLSSDSILHTYDYWVRMEKIVSQIPPSERESFNRISYTIGGMMLFPSNQVGGAQTINQQRGTHPRILDRFDLTLECIRRHYSGEVSPLTDTMARYADFFRLFVDFEKYVSFFLLQDLVDQTGVLKFWMPFDKFEGDVIPRTLEAYLAYRELATAFVEARDRRIVAYANPSTR